MDSQGDGSQPDTISIASRTSQNTLDSDKVMLFYITITFSGNIFSANYKFMNFYLRTSMFVNKPSVKCIYCIFFLIKKQLLLIVLYINPINPNIEAIFIKFGMLNTLFKMFYYVYFISKKTVLTLHTFGEQVTSRTACQN